MAMLMRTPVRGGAGAGYGQGLASLQGQDDPGRRAAMHDVKAQRALDLEQQIRERKERQALEKERERQLDQKVAAQAAAYNPWGKGGAGAPIRDSQGRIVTNLKGYKHDASSPPGYAVDASAVPVGGGAGDYGDAYGMPARGHPGGGVPEYAQPLPDDEGAGKRHTLFRFENQDSHKQQEMREKQRKQLEMQRVLAEQMEEQRARKAAEKKRREEQERRDEERLMKDTMEMQHQYERELSEKRAKDARKRAEQAKDGAVSEAGGGGVLERTGGRRNARAMLPPQPVDPAEKDAAYKAELARQIEERRRLKEEEERKQRELDEAIERKYERDMAAMQQFQERNANNLANPPGQRIARTPVGPAPPPLSNLSQQQHMAQSPPKRSPPKRTPVAQSMHAESAFENDELPDQVQPLPDNDPMPGDGEGEWGDEDENVALWADKPKPGLVRPPAQRNVPGLGGQQEQQRARGGGVGGGLAELRAEVSGLMGRRSVQPPKAISTEDMAFENVGMAVGGPVFQRPESGLHVEPLEQEPRKERAKWDIRTGRRIPGANSEMRSQMRRERKERQAVEEQRPTQGRRAKPKTLVSQRTSFMRKAAGDQPMSPLQKNIRGVKKEVRKMTKQANELLESMDSNSVFLNLDHDLMQVFGAGSPQRALSSRSPVRRSDFPQAVPRTRSAGDSPTQAQPLWPTGEDSVYYHATQLSPETKVRAQQIRGLDFPLKADHRDQLDTFLRDFLNRQ